MHYVPLLSPLPSSQGDAVDLVLLFTALCTMVRRVIPVEVRSSNSRQVAVSYLYPNPNPNPNPNPDPDPKPNPNSNPNPNPNPNQVGLVLLMVDAATDSLDMLAQLFIAYLSQASLNLVT